MTRFSRWALGAVVVVAAVLAALGWVSLRQWERSAEVVFREQARDMAAMAAEKIEMGLRDAPDDLVARLRLAAAKRDARPDVFDAVLAETTVRDVLEKAVGGLEGPDHPRAARSRRSSRLLARRSGPHVAWPPRACATRSPTGRSRSISRPGSRRSRPCGGR